MRLIKIMPTDLKTILSTNKKAQRLCSFKTWKSSKITTTGKWCKSRKPTWIFRGNRSMNLFLATPERGKQHIISEHVLITCGLYHSSLTEDMENSTIYSLYGEEDWHVSVIIHFVVYSTDSMPYTVTELPNNYIIDLTISRKSINFMASKAHYYIRKHHPVVQRIFRHLPETR